MTPGRVGAASSSYGDGDNWMVTGGTLKNGTMLNTSEIYDAATNKWREGPELPRDLQQHCQVQVSGEVIITGKFLLELLVLISIKQQPNKQKPS